MPIYCTELILHFQLSQQNAEDIDLPFLLVVVLELVNEHRDRIQRVVGVDG